MKQHKLNNADRALSQLESFCQVKKPTDLERAGVIQAFEFSYEVMWKLFKAYVEQQGGQATSPKDAIKKAFQYGVIENEELWLSIIKDRNLTVHIYNLDLSKNIHAKVVAHYAPAMRKAFLFIQEKT